MPSVYTPAEVINIAKLSQFYAANYIGDGSLFTPYTDPMHARQLYVERKSLEWAYDLDHNYSSLQNVANYVYRLCGKAGLKAIGVLGGGAGGGGTIINPTIPADFGFSFEYLIPITAADFFSSTEYRDIRIAGKQVEVFWKNIPNFQSTWGWRLIYTPNGFEVFVDDGAGGNSFDASGANADAEFEIFIVHPTGTVNPAPDSGSIVTYQAIGGETFFTDSRLVGKDASNMTLIKGTPYAIIPTGTPLTNQALFTSATGRFDFLDQMMAGEFIVVIIMSA